MAWSLTVRFQTLSPQKAKSVFRFGPPRHTPITRLRSGIGRMTCVGPSSAQTWMPNRVATSIWPSWA